MRHLLRPVIPVEKTYTQSGQIPRPEASGAQSGDQNIARRLQVVGMDKYAGLSADAGSHKRSNQEKDSEYRSQPNVHSCPVEKEGEEDKPHH